MAQLARHCDRGDIVLRPVMRPGSKMEPQWNKRIERAEAYRGLQRLDRLTRPAPPEAGAASGAMRYGRVGIETDCEICLGQTFRMPARHPQSPPHRGVGRCFCRVDLDRTACMFQCMR